MGKEFANDFLDRGTVKLTDKLLIHNFDTGVTEITTVQELLTAIGLMGVKFPAIQIPSADVNTLDDYEEGTWTPGITFGGASVGITYGITTGFYTRIGNIVTISGNIELTSKGVSVGIALITNLPFTVSGNNFAAVSLWFNFITFADHFQGTIVPATNQIELSEISNAGVYSDLTNADFANTSRIILNCTYRVA